MTISFAVTGDASVDPPSITFTPANYNVARPINVSALPNRLVDGTRAAELLASVSASDDADYAALAPVSVQLTVLDNDQASLAVSSTLLTFSEQAAAGATFDVSLGAQPNRTVTVTLSLSNASVATVTPSTLTFVPGSFPEPQVVTVTPIANEGVDAGGSRTALITLSTDSDEEAFRNLVASNVTVVVTDDDNVSAAPAGWGLVVRGVSAHAPSTARALLGGVRARG